MKGDLGAIHQFCNSRSKIYILDALTYSERKVLTDPAATLGRPRRSPILFSGTSYAAREHPSFSSPGEM